MGDNGLMLRVEKLEDGLQRETDKRERALKYVHNMLEDVQSRYADIRETFSRIEASFMQHLKDDRAMGEGITAMDARLRTIERLVWVALGGIIMLSAVIGFVGLHLKATFS